MNRSQQIKLQVARFLGQHYQISDSKSKINLLDLYENYLEFIFQNAIGYQMDVGDFSKEIKEVYPNTTIGDDKSVSGLTQKVYKPSAPIIRDVLGDTIMRRLSHLTRGAKESFRAAELAGVDSIDNENIEIEKVEAWLGKALMFYYNPHKNRYIRGD
jgi:hypothetical protein